MNRLITVALMSVLSLFVSPAVSAQNSGVAHLSIANAVCDFGEISRRGKDLVREVEFVNDGSAPLVVLSVTTSCSCLKADFSRKPIAAGGRGVIRIICESRKMDSGVFHRVIRVNSNSSDGVHLITVQGNASDGADDAPKTKKMK